MPFLAVAAIAVLGLSGAAAWVVQTEPDWYLRTRYPLQYEQIIRGYAANYGLDPALLAAVVYVESRFDPNARSDAGALGLMQLLPETAKGIARVSGDAGLRRRSRATQASVRGRVPGRAGAVGGSTAERTNSMRASTFRIGSPLPS